MGVVSVSNSMCRFCFKGLYEQHNAKTLKLKINFVTLQEEGDQSSKAYVGCYDCPSCTDLASTC